jgi:hypothetical protein
MNECTPDVSYEAKACNDGSTRHALLVTAYRKAVDVGLFDALDRHVHIRMRTRDYSPLDKFKTLIASILLGCDHTKEINTQLGAHEPELAALFGLRTRRFPDQSGINTLLRRCNPDSVTQVRQAAFDLLVANSRARDRRAWLRLPGGRRVLVADLDQHGLVVRGTTFELADDGFFGRKRGRRGYQVSLLYLGGQVREVLDEFLDPGSTYAGARVDALLERLGQTCDALSIARSDVLVRADAQYGTPAIIAKIEAGGFGYLIKGLSAGRAKRLMREHGAGACLEVATSGAGGEVRRVADVGWLEHVGVVAEGEQRPKIRARTVLGQWEHEVAVQRRRPGPVMRAKQRREGAQRRRVVTAEYWLTNVDAEDLPAVEAIEVYNGRQTIEAYFKDEQQALGARHVRTNVWAGEAVFEWLVAMTNNLLRWLQQQEWAGTVLEEVGLTRLVKEGMAIGGQIQRQGSKVLVTLERRHPLVRRLLTQWRALTGAVARGRTFAPSYHITPIRYVPQEISP